MKVTPILIVCLTLLLGACSLLSPEKEVTIDIPVSPTPLQKSLKGIWSLEMGSFSGEFQEKELDWSEGIPRKISMEWPKEVELLLLLTPPSWQPGLSPAPWGVYVSSLKDRGDISYKEGASISILMRILQAGVNLEGFNCSRFLEEMGTLDNPWQTDHELLMRQLGRQEMRSWYIRPKTLYRVNLTLPEGSWYFRSLLQEPVVSDGRTLEFTFPEGHTSLYNPASESVVEIQVDDHGEAVWMLTLAGNSHTTGACSVSSK
jgi:hypothetical protein